MLKWLNDVLRQQFGFSQNEIRGFYILIPLTVLIIYFPIYLQDYFQNQEIDYSEDQAILKEWYRQSKIQLKPEELKLDHTTMRHFNPNKLTAKEWMELGIQEEVAYRIINYRLSGGRFRNPEDLLKIYGINQELIKLYAEYMIIPVIKKAPKPKLVTAPVTHRDRNKDFVKFDLNEGDTTTFRTINGIGPYWSKRLVKFRDALGGFVHPNQVYELYGLDSSLATQVITSTFLNSPQVLKINVNEDSIKNLAKHPYISYKIGKSIVKYRKSHGDYSDISELKNIVLISDSLFQKVEPYLIAK